MFEKYKNSINKMENLRNTLLTIKNNLTLKLNTTCKHNFKFQQIETLPFLGSSSPPMPTALVLTLAVLSVASLAG